MTEKNKIVAAILAFVGGTIGLHNLYLGKIGAFIWTLILFILSMSIGIPITTFIGIFKGIAFIKMSDEKFAQRYNKGFLNLKRGPLEMRRESQMKEFKQITQNKPFPSKTPYPKNVQSSSKAQQFKISGIKKYKNFDLQDAITDFQEGIKLSPNDVALHFNIGCAYSLTEQKAKAYYHIWMAVKLGYKDFQSILSHDDLAFIRIQPEFEAFKDTQFSINPLQKEQAVNHDAPITNAHQPPNDSLLIQLSKLKELREKGLLSENEFVEERQKLLRQ